MSTEMAIEMRGQRAELQEGQEGALEVEGTPPVVVYDEVTKYGLRTLHAMISCDGKPEPGELLRRVPAQSLTSLEIRTQADPEIAGIWHIYMCWHPHERARGPEGREGVLWYIEEGGRVSAACQDAAAMFRVLYDRWPGKILTAIKLKEHERWASVFQEDAIFVTLPIEVVGWVPARCVFAVDPSLNPSPAAQEREEDKEG